MEDLLWFDCWEYHLSLLSCRFLSHQTSFWLPPSSQLCAMRAFSTAHRLSKTAMRSWWSKRKHSSCGCIIDNCCYSAINPLLLSVVNSLSTSKLVPSQFSMKNNHLFVKVSCLIDEIFVHILWRNLHGP